MNISKYIYVFYAFFILLGSIACHQMEQTPVAKKFLDFSALDSTVKPGDDFYSFANGKWVTKTIIPPTESGVGVFKDLMLKTHDNLHFMLDSLSKLNNSPGSIEQKVSDLYSSGMDTGKIDQLGYNPAKSYLEKIDEIKNSADILQYVQILQKENVNILYNLGIGPDNKNSKVNIVSFSQSGLGLPDRDYYFKKDSANLKVVNGYKKYILKLFMLSEEDSVKAESNLRLVFDLEKKMAESHRTNQALRDPQSNYHKLSVAILSRQMPQIDWKNTLSGLGINQDSINLQQPAYYSKLNELLKNVQPDVWKAYLQFHTLDFFSSSLSNDFEMARFNYDMLLTGQQVIKPRWFRIVSVVDGEMGEALGQIYVKRYFSDDAKKRMLSLVNNLQIAFESRINHLDWMSDSSKTKAKEKLHFFIKKIGYPDTWKDYSKVVIDKHKYFENIVSCSENEYQRTLAKLDTPVDRTEWGMTPPTVNAYYNASFNEIVFPAGFLQPPFFDPSADDAVNYGAIGIVIGHEMTHGFDDQGSQFDKDGNLRNWWSHEDSLKFVSKTKLVVLQYNGFIAVDTFHVNGALTTGENIADFGGLSIAYDAFKLTKQGQDTSRIDGLTPDERFFLSFAAILRSKYKEELMRMAVNEDPQSPNKFRLIGPLENFTPFYTTFNLQKGDKMYKPEAERIKIW